MAKIFLTGATGYIGGDALHALYKSHPEYKISALVRDQQKAAPITKEYPNVRIVPGSLEDGDLITSEASKADIVLNFAATSHLPSVQAIHAGLKARKGSTPAHWVQISGATLLAGAQIAEKNFGDAVPTPDHHDLDAASLWSLISRSPGRVVDNFIRTTATSDPTISTALLVGPIIYGAGRGPGNQRSIQVPEVARTTIARGKAWRVGRGEAAWDSVHVRDLSALAVRLVERAVENGGAEGGVWNEEGMYFTGTGRMTFGEVAKRVAQSASKLGLIELQDVEELKPEEADKLVGHASVLLGTDARCEARRAVEKLGWKPAGESLEEGIEETVREEAGKLGKAGGRAGL